MVNRMRPGADRALKDGRRRGLYTDCEAASNRSLLEGREFLYYLVKNYAEQQ